MRITCLAFALACFTCSQLTAGIFNTNIIVNGDAEAAPGSTNGDTFVPIPGWTPTDGFIVDAFGPAFDTEPVGTPGLPNPGNNFFAGGPTNGASSATQLINVAAGAALIDSGLVRAELAGWLGGYQNQDDNAVLVATYLNAGSATLGQLSIGPVLAVDRTNITQFLFRANTNTVPAGTRQIQLILAMTRHAGNYNDGYADDLSLVLRNPLVLQISNAAKSVVLSWPTNFPDFELQTVTSLAPPQTNWTLATNIIATNGGFFLTTNRIGLSRQFFRLASP